MKISEIQTLAILLFLFAAACAKSNTRLGRVEDNDAESIQEGGASSDSAPSSDSGRPSESDEAEDNGQDSTSIADSMDASMDGYVATDSIPPSSVLVPVEDPEVRQARLDLISEYCSLTD